MDTGNPSMSVMDEKTCAAAQDVIEVALKMRWLDFVGDDDRVVAVAVVTESMVDAMVTMLLAAGLPAGEGRLNKLVKSCVAGDFLPESVWDNAFCYDRVESYCRDNL